MKPSTKNSTGTHFLDVTVFATLDELIAICGTPQSTCDKCRHHWKMETAGGGFFTIYDWKQPFEIELDEPITWNIGSFDYLTADTARYEINQALKQIRNEIPA